MFFHHFCKLCQPLRGKRVVLKYIVLNLLLSQALHQLPTPRIQSLQNSFQMRYSHLRICIFILLSQCKVSFKLVPAHIEVAFVSFLYLLAGLKFFAGRQKYFHLWAEFRIKKRIVYHAIEESGYHFCSSFDKLFVFAQRYLWFDKSKESIRRKSWKDETSLFFRQNLT